MISRNPIGSLGRLEEIAVRLFAIRGQLPELPMKKAVYVFAADHGITAEGVSAYPSEVTYQMVLNFLSGGAAINVLARLHGAQVHVVDVGVDADFANQPRLLHYKVRRGSRNMFHGPAMTDAELAAALSAGIALADAANAEGVTPVGRRRDGHRQYHRRQRDHGRDHRADAGGGHWTRHRPQRRSTSSQSEGDRGRSRTPIAANRTQTIP